jgi:glycosyltransferase involved in cell wall biosynthesis
MRHLYSAADIVVVPSLQDNLPGTALEASACGRATLAFRTGGLVDIIESGQTGFLIDDFDPIELAERIYFLFKNPELRIAMERGARERAKNNWEPLMVASRYRDLFCEMKID